MLMKNPVAHWFYGTETDDRIYGSADNDVIYGFGGDDFLYGDRGADVMIGGIGDDDYYVDSPGDAVIENAGEGRDTVVSSIDYTLPANVEDLHLYGGAFSGTGNELDNQINGNDNDNILTGRGGDDWIAGGAGADTMIGGKGDDHFFVDQSGDVVIENYREGNDTVFSTISYTLGTWVENLTLEDSGGAIDGTGNDLDNIIQGNDSMNVLTGGGGDDWIYGRGGADTMIGGKGDDHFFVDQSGDVVIENYREGNDEVVSSISYTLGTWVENLELSYFSGAINGTGNDLDNIIQGNDSMNVLTGGGGDDWIYGQGGADTMIGGLGDDILFVEQSGDVVVENYGEGNDTVWSSITYTLGANIEYLRLDDSGGAINGTGNELDNQIWGNSSGNILDGSGGVDLMIGGGGDDIYIVDDFGDLVKETTGQGIDTVQTSVSYALAAGSEVEVLEAGNPAAVTAINLTGNEFDNSIVGNDGQNIIVGGLGIDTLQGNGGGDIFVWASTAETLQAGNLADVVMDFNRQEGDLLALNLIDADGDGANGDTAFTFVGQVDLTKSFFTGAGQIGYFTTATDTYILINTVVNPGADGIDYEEATIRLAGVHNPDASWFAL